MTLATIVLDDDPTGSQCAADAPVLLRFGPRELTDALGAHDGFFVVTNTRSLSTATATALMISLKADAERAAAALGKTVRFVLRGDSTLRGHIAAELDVFASPGSVTLFVPAFPDAGRITRAGAHLLQVDGEWINVADSEFARDSTFGYESRSLPEFIATHAPGRPIVAVRPGGVEAALRAARPGTVVIPDVETNADIVEIHQQLVAAQADGVDVLLRCASPLAALAIGRFSAATIEAASPNRPGTVLVVCGSHTLASTRQLAKLSERVGAPVVLDTELAVADPAAAAAAAAQSLRSAFVRSGRSRIAILATARLRTVHHADLGAGARVMTALTNTVAAVADQLDSVVAKGGITSAEVARTGLGADRAVVRGQLHAGISLWDLELGPGRTVDYVVVPGNVGDSATLVAVLEGIGYRLPGLPEAGSRTDDRRSATSGER